MNTRGKVAFSSLGLGVAAGVLLALSVSIAVGLSVIGAVVALFLAQVALAARSQHKQLGSPGSLGAPRSLSSPKRLR